MQESQEYVVGVWGDRYDFPEGTRPVAVQKGEPRSRLEDETWRGLLYKLRSHYSGSGSARPPVHMPTDRDPGRAFQNTGDDGMST